MKFFGLPTVLAPSVITTEECADMYRRWANMHKCRTIKVELNSVVSIPMVVHSLVSHDKNKVYCTGAKFTIDGEQHNNMLNFETIRLSMVELSIQVGDQDVQELREMAILSPT